MCPQSRLTKIIQEITQKVQALLGDRLHNIILYGSYARGDFDEESDIDIMVLADINEDEMRPLEYDLNKISSRVSLKHDITVCIMMNNKNLFEQRLPILPFYQNVINDGVQIYAGQ